MSEIFKQQLVFDLQKHMSDLIKLAADCGSSSSCFGWVRRCRTRLHHPRQPLLLRNPRLHRLRHQLLRHLRQSLLRCPRWLSRLPHQWLSQLLHPRQHPSPPCLHPWHLGHRSMTSLHLQHHLVTSLHLQHHIVMGLHLQHHLVMDLHLQHHLVMGLLAIRHPVWQWLRHSNLVISGRWRSTRRHTIFKCMLELVAHVSSGRIGGSGPCRRPSPIRSQARGRHG